MSSEGKPTNGSYDFSLVDIILSQDEKRHISLADYCSNAPTGALLQQCEELDKFSRTSENLYEKVRALFFLYAIHRFHLTDLPSTGSIPYEGYKNLLDRKFLDAIDVFLKIHHREPSKAISSALAKSYYHLGFQTLGTSQVGILQILQSFIGSKTNAHPIHACSRSSTSICQEPRWQCLAVRSIGTYQTSQKGAFWFDGWQNSLRKDTSPNGFIALRMV